MKKYSDGIIMKGKPYSILVLIVLILIPGLILMGSGCGFGRYE